MNENLNLVEILKDCQRGISLYSTVHGEVTLADICDGSTPICVQVITNDGVEEKSCYGKDGRLDIYCNGECILFPSKDQRDWSKFKINKSKFDPRTLQPFDKVLVIDGDRSWTPLLFTKLNYSLNYPRMLCFDLIARKVVPYNEETKHLLGTTDEAPEFYRYWED